MKQLSKVMSIVYHLYPGIIITAGFVLLAPWVMKYGFPPQFALLLCIIILAVPVLLAHLLRVKKQEHLPSLSAVNGFTNKLSNGKLIGYSIALVAFAFIVWGAAQPLNLYISNKFFGWLPSWYTVQDFAGYSKNKILITLVCNLGLNGLLAPYIEELYFRGYLLPRMNSWGKSAFLVNVILFSLYHFWQPYVYVTLFISLLPMVYLVYKTKDLRLSILTHTLLNVIGALLSFALLLKK